MNTKELTQKYIAGTYARFDLELCSGHGATVCDDSGKEYIDFGSGIAVNSFGVADSEWADAVTAQLKALQHTSNLYFSAPQAKLAEALCLKTGLKKVFFGNSGAEANECAIKTARKYSFDKYGEGRSTIITLKNSFHGRTVTTLAATGQDGYHTLFSPFTEGFAYAEPNNIDELKKLCADGGIAAIMFEIIQGEGGVNCLDAEYVSAMAKLAAANDILMIADEVQTGNGRSGKYFAYMNFGIEPDIVTTAKGLGGGLPIGATLFGEKTKDVLQAGNHGSTFGGNPAVAAGALTVVSRLNDEFLQAVAEKGEYIKKALLGCKNVKAISGMGLMLGIETEKDAKSVAAECIANGLLVLTAKTKIRLLPPLNISDAELQKGVEILKRVIEE